MAASMILLSFLGLLEMVVAQDPDEFCRRFQSARDIWEPSEQLIGGLLTLMETEIQLTGDIQFNHTPYLTSAEHMEHICQPVLEPEVVNVNGCGWNSSLGCAIQEQRSSVRPKRQTGTEKLKDTSYVALLDDLFVSFDVKNVFLLVHEMDYQAMRMILDHAFKTFTRRGLYVGTKIVNRYSGLVGKSIGKSNPAYVILSNLTRMEGVLEQYERAGYVNNGALWVVKSWNPKDQMKSLNLRLDSQVFVVSQDQDTFAIQEVYRVANDRPMIVNPVGVWSKMSGLVMTALLFWERRKNLGGIEFLVATVEDQPIIYTSFPEGPDGPLEVSGLLHDIWLQMEVESNFSSKIIHSIDGKWGSQGEDGRFNGLIGMVERNEVMAALSGLALNQQRASVADYMMPFGNFKEGLFYKHNADGFAWMTYLSPLEKHTWIVIGITYLVCGVFLWITARFGKVIEEDYDFNLPLSMMIMIHGMTNQGAPYEPKKASTRFVFLGVFLIGLLVSASYSAALTSFLAVKIHKPPFRNMKEMLYDTNYNIVTVAGTNYVEIFSNGDYIKREIFEKRMDLKTSFDAIMETIDTEPNKAILWTKVAMAIVFQGACEYKAVPEFNMLTPFTVYMEKDTPYRQLFDYHTAKMVESGQMHKLEMKWFPHVGEEQCNSLTTEGLGMNNVISIFVFIILMGFLCILIMICEICYKRCCASNQTAKTKSDHHKSEQKEKMKMESKQTIDYFKKETIHPTWISS